MSPGAEEDRSSLLRIARRRAWIVVMLALVCAAVAYAISHGQHKTYTATALLLFQQQPLGQEVLGYNAAPIASDPGVAEATDAELVSAPGIIRATATRLRLSTKAVADAIVVTPAGTSQVISVAAAAATPSAASELANTYAATVVDTRRSQERQLVVDATQRVKSQLATLKRNFAPAPQVKALADRLDQLGLLAAVQTGDVQVADPADPPSSPSGPRIRRDTAFGLVIGGLIGLVVVMLLELQDRRLRDEDDLAALYGVPVLGRIPQARAAALRAPGTGRQRPDPILTEAHYGLRARLRYFDVDHRLQTLLITSALPREGKSTVAWNLARAALVSSPDERVLLIEADMRRPTISVMAGTDPTPGLSEALTRLHSWREAIQVVDVGAQGGGVLHVLTAGAAPPNPTQLIASARMRALLAETSREYGLIIIDAPPPLVVSDALALLRHVDGVVVVGRLNHARRDAAMRLRSTLTEVNAPLLGLVVNGLSRGDRSYGYRSYGSPKRSRSLFSA